MKTNYNYELIKDYLDRILDAETSKQIEELITNDETARNDCKRNHPDAKSARGR